VLRILQQLLLWQDVLHTTTTTTTTTKQRQAALTTYSTISNTRKARKPACKPAEHNQ